MQSNYQLTFAVTTSDPDTLDSLRDWLRSRVPAMREQLPNITKIELTINVMRTHDLMEQDA